MSADRSTGGAVPETMRAVRLHHPGGPDRLVFEEVDTPRPGTGEVLVKVHAAAITRDELTWPVDRLPAIPSYELSGVVAALGPEASVMIGQHVYALTPFDRDGAAADYTSVPAELLAPKPRTLSHAESAAIPLAGLTAWQGLFVHGRLVEGQRVLILGATGGVGHLATQLARWRAAHVIGTSSADGAEAARRLGAHEVLDSARFEDALDTVDLVLDTVGGDILRRSMAVLGANGRLVSVAEEPKPPAEVQIRSSYFVVEPNREQLEQLTGLVDRGELRPSIDSLFPLSEGQAAFERSMAAGKRGKVVLQVAQVKQGAERERRR
jgi:NADPH:quinone reductase-like Zn-dependent oxidoreductase